MMKTAYLSTLGCKVNQFETAAFKHQLERRGLSMTTDPESADLIIVNTCTVTAKAGAESRREVKKMLRRNQQAIVVVTGCHAQLEYEELKQLAGGKPERLVVAGNEAKDSLISELFDDRSSKNEGRREAIGDKSLIGGLRVERFDGRTRAYLRVQDGCESFCSYCIVPYARGRSRSLPIDEAIRQAADYLQAGHREIVVTGIHVGRYGADLSEDCQIAELLSILCKRFPAIRFRLSSIEPLEIDERLLSLMATTPNLMPHLHIPLQSGDDEVLKRMNRRYTRQQFIDVLKRCREQLPEAAIGLDVMAGFPGETETMFNNTEALIESSDCTYLHVFPYSRRPGTRAAAFDQQIDKSIKQQRVDRLRRLSEKKSRTFYQRFINTERTVLFETHGLGEDVKHLHGYTDNYIPVVTERPGALPTGPVAVQLAELMADSIRASIV
jgi:threonylcarbamoyladenosine tRNA methylthiotransferase MtaB